MDTVIIVIFAAGLILLLAAVLLLAIATRSLATMAGVMQMAHAPEIEAYQKAKQALPAGGGMNNWEGPVPPMRYPESG